MAPNIPPIGQMPNKSPWAIPTFKVIPNYCMMIAIGTAEVWHNVYPTSNEEIDKIMEIQKKSQKFL